MHLSAARAILIAASPAPLPVRQAEQGDIERILGQDPESGLDVHIKNGRFGAYIQLGDTGRARRKSRNAPVFPKVKHRPRWTLDYALEAFVFAA